MASVSKQVAGQLMEQLSNTLDNSAVGVLLTATEFLTRFEPGALNLLSEPERTLREDTIRAAAIATRGGLRPAGDGRYPLSVWERVYPL
jgi:hypothetical protein